MNAEDLENVLKEGEQQPEGDTSAAVETPQEDEVVVKAKEKGWLPQEEFKGDPEDWVEAKEFLAREPLYKAIHKQSRENKKLMEMNQEIKKMLVKVQKTSYEQALKDLKVKYDQAAESNDVKTAVEVHSQIKELEQEASAPAIRTPEDAAATAFNDWVEENNWYATDKMLQRYANGVGSELIREKMAEKDEGEILSVAELNKIYQEVTQTVKESFPDKFQNKARGKPSAITEPSKRTVTKPTTSKKVTFENLPNEAQEAYKMLVKSKSNPRGVFETGDDYIESYLAGGGELRG